jgi:hypothetical protein
VTDAAKTDQLAVVAEQIELRPIDRLRPNEDNPNHGHWIGHNLQKIVMRFRSYWINDIHEEKITKIFNSP